MKDYIWTPDLFIYRTQKIRKDNVLTSQNFQINVLQQFYTCLEMTVKTKCRMQLIHFPHDHQKCHLEIGSFGYPDQYLLPKLYEKASIEHVPNPNGYTIRMKKKVQINSWPLGNYTTVGYEVKITRHITFYVLNYYIPTGLMVIISFASFAIPASSEGKAYFKEFIFLSLIHI